MKKNLFIVAAIILALLLVVLFARKSTNNQQSVNTHTTSQQASTGRTNTMDSYMQAFSQAVEGKIKVDDLHQEFFLQQQFFDPTGAMYPAITRDYFANWVVQKKIELNKYVPSTVVTWTTGNNSHSLTKPYQTR